MPQQFMKTFLRLSNAFIKSTKMTFQGTTEMLSSAKWSRAVTRNKQSKWPVLARERKQVVNSTAAS